MSVTIREPGSAITHFIGMMMAIIASTPLLIKAVLSNQPEVFAAMMVFIASMILLYGASATYHSINVGGRILRVFRKIDHMMIFVLIAGSYTPICLVVLGGKLHSAGGCLGGGNSWYGHKGSLDYLSQMVFLCHLYCNGLDMPGCFRPAVEHPSPGRVYLAAGRRADLYDRRYYICVKAPYF